MVPARQYFGGEKRAGREVGDRANRLRRLRPQEVAQLTDVPLQPYGDEAALLSKRKAISPSRWKVPGLLYFPGADVPDFRLPARGNGKQPLVRAEGQAGVIDGTASGR